MATYTVGAAGYMYTRLSAAHGAAVAAVDGAAVFELYGPHTELSQSITWNLTGATINVLADTYTFDGQAGTAQWLDVPGGAVADGLTINGRDFLEVTGYTTGPVLDVLADSCTFENFTLTGNGVAGTGINQIYAQSSTGLRFKGITVTANVDPSVAAAAACVGMYFNGVKDSIVDGCSITTLTTTGAGNDLWGIHLVGNAENIQIYRTTIRGCTATDWCGGMRLTGPATTAGQMSRVAQCSVYDMTSGSFAYGFRLEIGSYEMFNNLCYNLTYGTEGRAILSYSADPDPTNPSTLIYNNTFHGTGYGVFQYNRVPETPLLVYNNIAVDCTLAGFAGKIAALPHTSNFNVAYNSNTNFGPNWTTGGSDVTTDPTLADPVGLDFSLAFGSPAINSGMTLAATTYDHEGLSRPQGAAYDRGAYEYPGTQYVVVLGSHMALGSTGTLAANFVLVSNPATKVAATTVTHVTDFIAQYGLVTGSAGGYVSVGGDLFQHASAVFQAADEGKTLYVYDCDYANWGTTEILTYVSPTVVQCAKSFMLDPTNGSMKWAVLPGWALTVMDRYSTLTRTGSRVIHVGVPTGTPADDYYIEIINQNGESTIFNDQVIAVTS